MSYQLFLFDLDDTLLDFKASERLSFYRALESTGLDQSLDELFQSYQRINHSLWQLFEAGSTTKEELKVERFRQTLANHREIDPLTVSQRYLDLLPETVVLMDYAVEICEYLASRGEIGIITNGLEEVQSKRIARSALAPFISFISVSEACGFAKPDIRFFEYTVKNAGRFDKEQTIIIGDRFEADIVGAGNFGIDSCWFNPTSLPRPLGPGPTFEIKHLKELKALL